MKRAHILPAVLLFLVGACSEEEASVDIAPVGEPASVSVTAELPAAAHGGTVLMAGDQPIEVVADEEGAFLAYYLDGPPEAPQDAQVTIRVPEASGEIRPVMLTWDPGEARYFGQLRGATPVPGPLEIVIDLGGERVRASAPTFVLVEPFAVHVDPPAVDVHVQAPSGPKVVVDAPARPHVIVERPSRPHVVVEAPAPPSIRVRAPEPPRVQIHAPSPPSVRVRAPAPPSVRVRAPEPPSVRVRAPAPPSVRVRAEGPRVRVRAERGNRGRGRGRD